jgi:hypothetical protein
MISPASIWPRGAAGRNRRHFLARAGWLDHRNKDRKMVEDMDALPMVSPIYKRDLNP